jgi:hypothetical protein
VSQAIESMFYDPLEDDDDCGFTVHISEREDLGAWKAQLKAAGTQLGPTQVGPLACTWETPAGRERHNQIDSAGRCQASVKAEYNP